MSRRALEKSVRMFRTLCEDTIKKGGSTPLGARGVDSLFALEDVLSGKRRFDGALLKPLAAFSHLLSSGQLPPGFARLNFGDAVLAVSEAMAHDSPRWPFDPALDPAVASKLGFDAVIAGIDRLEQENRAGWKQHGDANAKFILNAALRAPRHDLVVICGGARAYDVPLAELAERFERVVVTDVSMAAAEQTVRDRVPEARRSRVRVELFDLTGSYNRFVSSVDAALGQAKTMSDAERALLELVGSYDTAPSAARLSSVAAQADLAVSSMVLSQLGVGFKAYVTERFAARGWDRGRVKSAPLEPALSTLASLVEQHHIAALLTHAQLAVITSDVSASVTVAHPDGSVERKGDPQEQLSVDALCDRIPGRTEIIADASWDWPRVMADKKAVGMTMRVDAIAVRRRA
jgi:hypothetical protein